MRTLCFAHRANAANNESLAGLEGGDVMLRQAEVTRDDRSSHRGVLSFWKEGDRFRKGKV